MADPDGGRARSIEERLALAEAELRASRERVQLLQRVLDHTYQFLGVLSLDGILLEANHSALALVGTTLDAVIGKPFVDTPWWTHSPLLQRRLTDALALARAGELVRFEVTHVAVTGALHIVDFSVKPLVGENGDVARLVVEGRDLTDRRRAEEALRASREMLRVVLDTIPVRVFWKDLEGRYLGCNTAFARDAGVETVEEVVGKTDYDLAWRALAESFRGDDRRVTSSGTAILSYEEPSTSPEGGELWLSTSKIPLRNALDAVVGVLGVYEDITERKLDEAQRIALEARMQSAQKLESLGLLAGTIAHDFNNLLTVIVGNIGLVKKAHSAQPAALESVATIEAAARRAGDLCKQLLAYSVGGQRALAPVDVNAVVRETSAILHVAVSKKARLALTLREPLPTIDGDATQLQQILMNLITNASQALGDAEGDIRVRTSSSDGAAKTVSIEVEDTGSGMSEATLARIFEPFFTTKGAGHGLGLAAVRGIVEAHQGTIEVSSEASKGTLFRITFPASTAPTDIAGSPLPDAKPLWRGEGRVLLVDDEPMILTIGEHLLRLYGFEVETARDGREALERFEVGKFAVVVVDLTMPRIDGLEVTRGIRARDPLTKVILTSGYDVSGALAQLERMRPDGFLAKPFSLESLGDAVRRVLPRRLEVTTVS